MGHHASLSCMWEFWRSEKAQGRTRHRPRQGLTSTTNSGEWYVLYALYYRPCMNGIAFKTLAMTFCFDAECLICTHWCNQFMGSMMTVYTSLRSRLQQRTECLQMAYASRLALSTDIGWQCSCTLSIAHQVIHKYSYILVASA